MSVNKVILLGRLGQDPELKYTPSGAAVCSFSMATSENWTDKSGQKQEKTEWHKIVVWGKLAEVCNQYLAKGRQAYIEGRLQTRSWEDNTGQKRYMTEINASTVQFIGEKAAANGQQRNEYSQEAPSNNSGASQSGSVLDQDYHLSSDASFTADDIPF